MLSPNKKNPFGFVRNQQFFKALVMVIGLAVPVAAGIQFDRLYLGIHMAIGAMLASPSDVYGNLQLKVKGMAMATLMVMLVTVLSNFLKGALWILFPSMALLMFAISYISIFGFRASLISFSGLFAIVLNFSSISETDLPLGIRVLFIGLGGLWYIGLSLLRHVIFPKGPIQFYLGETLNLTADYLETRAKLIDVNNDRRKLLTQLFESQNELTEKHESLRELLIVKKRYTHRSLFRIKRLLIFRQLVDILELAMANSVNYYKTDNIFKERPDQLQDFQEVLFAMSTRLREVAAHLSKPFNLEKSEVIKERIERTKDGLLSMQKEGHSDDAFLTFLNYWKYQKELFEKIAHIEWVLKSRGQQVRKITNIHVSPSFLTRQDFNLSVLRENFSLKSTTFRHALRIAIIGVLGYGIGVFFNVENAYWILLTIIVIMRPKFGLTKERLRNRSIGTIIGGALAFVIIYFIHSPTVYGILAITCFVIGFSMVQRDYRLASGFLTMYILSVYALLEPNVLDYIQFRVLDTLIGAGLAFVGNLFLWPSWEIKNINRTLADSFKANRDYLGEIAGYYEDKGREVPLSYKLSRKQAFIAFSDLSSSFERMTREPRGRQKSKDDVYRIVMLSNSFVASLASLGTFIINNPTTTASSHFNEIIAQVKTNLRQAEKMVSQPQLSKHVKYEMEEDEVETRLQESLNKVTGEGLRDSSDFQIKVEEAHLVKEQLKWLLAMSQRIHRILREIKFG